MTSSLLDSPPTSALLANDLLLRAARGEATERTPIWLMRQAGRYMPEYRAVRAKHGFLQMVKTPEVATEVTMQPIEAFNPDAAIIFADILPPLEGLGLQLSYEQGEGPVIHNPIRSEADVAALRPSDPREDTAYTIEAVRLTKQALAGRVPLFGFSGAPFTLASYAIEGGGSREYRRTKQMMYQRPELWHQLLSKLNVLVSDYLIAQAEAGADIVQVFDSWAGSLSPFDYRELVLPHTAAAIARFRAAYPHIPVIYFGTDMGGMYGDLRATGADVIGVDWRSDLDAAWAQIGYDKGAQGNLDPLVLHGPWSEVERRARDVLQRAGGRPGHIFNLGHGILTETPVENVAQLVRFVQEYRHDA